MSSCLARCNNSIFFAISFSNVLMWSFHVMHSSIIKPKNLIYLFRFISLVPITNSGIFKGILSLVEGLWKRVLLLLLLLLLSLLFFFAFNYNLLPLNQWLTLTNSVFTIWKSVFVWKIFMRIKEVGIICKHNCI